MRYTRFLGYNAAGGLVWGTSFVLLGYVAGNSYAAVEKAVGRGAALAVLALVLVALVTGDYADATPNAARTANRRHEGRKIGRAARGRHDGVGRTGRRAR